MTDRGPVLRLTGVTKDYVGAVVTHVLHGIDMTIGHGEFVALVGPSGSGKSTLLNLLGLLDRPTAGTIEIAGRNTTELDEAALTRFRGHTIGFVFQFHHLLPAFTARENVMLPMIAARGRYTPDMDECADMLIDRVGLTAERDRLASRLSGGQQQRVAIARSLAMAPALVLADEPTGNLDTGTGDQVFELLRVFQRKSGTTFLVVTHDPRLAERCDRVITLVDGRIVSDTRK